MLFQFYDRHAGIALAEFGKVIGFDVFLPAQIFMDPLAESAGALTVDNADCVQMREQGVVQIFVQLCHCFINSPSEQVDLGADGQGFAHTDLPF